MSRKRLSPALRKQVASDFQNRCAYCHSLVMVTGARLVIDHIVPEVAGGEARLANLCLACHSCNEFKGIQTRAIDPLSRRRVPLFHPRRQRWSNHFAWSADATRL